MAATCYDFDSDSASDTDSDDTTSSFEDFHRQLIEDCKNGTLQPYRFEPLAKPGKPDKENDSDLKNPDRLKSSDWCQCDDCVIMPTVKESICCREIKSVMNVIKERSDIKCIMEHPGFKPVCLNKYVLECAYNTHRMRYNGVEMDDTPERSRIMACRQFVWWCWGYLGKNINVQLPSCVVKTIRETFVLPNSK